MTGRYDDIIDRPHPVSRRHPQMTMSGRAAQFSSFAALSGYEDAVRETARCRFVSFASTRSSSARFRSRAS